MYVTPVGGDEACVALITRDPHLRLDAAMPHFPELARRLDGARHRQPGARGGDGHAPLEASLSRAHRADRRRFGFGGRDHRRRHELGFSTSHRCWPMRWSPDNLEQYQAAHRRMARRPAFMAQLMLMLDRFPRCGRPCCERLRRSPSIFERLLAVHAGA